MAISVFALCKNRFINRSLRNDAVKFINELTGGIQSFRHRFTFPVTNIMVRLLDCHCQESRFIKPVFLGRIIHTLKLIEKIKSRP